MRKILILGIGLAGSKLSQLAAQHPGIEITVVDDLSAIEKVNPFEDESNKFPISRIRDIELPDMSQYTGNLYREKKKTYIDPRKRKKGRG